MKSPSIFDMKLENLFKTIQVLRYMKENPECIVPDMRETLGIIHSNPPTQEEKDLYKIISTLTKKNYIEKIPIKKRELGGPHFSLTITELGIDFFDQLGLSTDVLPTSEKEKIMKELEVNQRLIIREILKGKISKPQAIEIVPELSDALITGLSSFLNDINFIRDKN